MPASHRILVVLRALVLPAVLATGCVVSSSDSNKKSATVAADSARQRAAAIPDTGNEVTANLGDVNTLTDTTEAADTFATMDSVRGAAAAPAPRSAQGDSTRRFATVTDTAAALRTITPTSAAARPTRFPFTPKPVGPDAMHVQVLLDRGNFSPGLLTGIWNDNSRRALQWFQVAHGLDSTGVVDQNTYTALTQAAGTAPLFVRYTVTDADLAGPFVKIPSNVYEKAKLKCLCYTSAAEELGERFHMTPATLARLNPRVDLHRLRAGTTLDVPGVARDTAAPAPYTVGQLMISKTAYWTNVLDAAGHIVAHYPSTIGNQYDPSPTGQFAVTRIVPYPAFHYQPTLFAEVPDTRPEAHLPKGPNSPVGVVWMALSKEHYGIHGTEDPSTIGTPTSHGCVRLTNWDAWTLSRAVRPGTPVHFQ